MFPRILIRRIMQHNETDGVYWITRRDQYDCLTSARRMDIIDVLANVGEKSVREIAALLGAKPSSLYHHIDLLLGVELIELAGTRSVNRRQEKLYKTPGANLKYGLALDDPKAFEIYGKIAAAQARQSARDFERGLETNGVVAHGPYKNIWIFRLVGAPDAATMEKINFHIEELAKLFWGSAGKENPLVVMSAMIAPITGGNAAQK